MRTQVTADNDDTDCYAGYWLVCHCLTDATRAIV